MGSCLSKKGSEKKNSDGDAAAAAAPPPSLDPPNVPSGSKISSSCDAGHHDKKIITQEEERQQGFEKKKEGDPLSSEIPEDEMIVERNRKGLIKAQDDHCNGGGSGAAVRTSSCTKEELDAILIQCGRLSRSSSGKGGSCSENQNVRSHRFAGSKRSYDFDRDDRQEYYDRAEEDHKARTATARVVPRRRTPSRERDGLGATSQLNRSSSFGEEGGRSTTRRRASRSPGRRSETPAADNSINNNKRPAKIVSIPATAPVKRGLSTASSSHLKRSGEGVVVGVRSNPSPRARSPATTTGRSAAANENGAPQPSLSRNSSRKTEHSPFRRNPLQEIDDNAMNIKLQQPAADLGYRSNANKMTPANIIVDEKGLDAAISHLYLPQKTTERATQMQKQHRKSSPLRKKSTREQLISCRAAEPETVPHEINQETADTKRGQTDKDLDVPQETPNFQKLTRSRSSRRSRDLDLVINSSYGSLLVENNSQLESAGFTLPACVSKACSILEAVADLNSSATSNRSSALSYNGGKFLPEADGAHNRVDKTTVDRFGEGKLLFGRIPYPFLESEVAATGDDLTVPSLHKYVTARDFRGGAIDEQESMGSNTFLFLDDDDDTGVVASKEPSSQDSTDRYKSLSKAIVDLDVQASSTKAKKNWVYNEAFSVQTKVQALS